MAKVQCAICKKNCEIAECKPYNSHYTDEIGPNGKVGIWEYEYICKDCLNKENKN